MRLNNTLFLLLGQTRLFWKLRVALDRLKFLCHQKFFGVRRRIEEHGTQTISFISLVRLTLSQVVLAILIAVALQLSHSYLTPIYAVYDLHINDNEYETLLATVTGVGSIFIGLYYAAISTIGELFILACPIISAIFLPMNALATSTCNSWHLLLF